MHLPGSRFGSKLSENHCFSQGKYHSEQFRKNNMKFGNGGSEKPLFPVYTTDGRDIAQDYDESERWTFTELAEVIWPVVKISVLNKDCSKKYTIMAINVSKKREI